MSSTISRIGKYELRQVLARTPTSIVHDGWDCDLERRVAIKTLSINGSAPGTGSLSGDGTHSDSIRRGSLRGLGAGTLSDDSAGSSSDESIDSLTRFRRGARAAGKLVHPSIAGVYDYGETHDRAYIVMEYIDGPTLKELFDRKQRFDAEEIVGIICSILEALQYSHDHGVVHRDIKPANVMFTSDMRVKLTDFGIARLEDSDVTQTGTIMGTPAYMSPEQFLGEKVDWRSDLYSTGVILYQMLTGERPYEGSVAMIMHKVLYTSPPPPSQVSSVNANFDDVVARAMAKKREQRLPDARAFIAALRAAVTEDPGRAPTAFESAGGVERGLRARLGPARAGGSAVRPGTRKPAQLGARPGTPGTQSGAGQTGSRTLLLIASGIGGLLLAGGTAAWLMHGPSNAPRDGAPVRTAQGPTSQGSGSPGSAPQGSPSQGSASQGTAIQGSSPGTAFPDAGQGAGGQRPSLQGSSGPAVSGPASGSPASSSQDQRAQNAPSGMPNLQGQNGSSQVLPPRGTPLPSAGGSPPAPTFPSPGTGAPTAVPPGSGAFDGNHTLPQADSGRSPAGDTGTDLLPLPPIPDAPSFGGTQVPSFPPDASRNAARRPATTPDRKAEPERRATEPPAGRFALREDGRPAPGAPSTPNHGSNPPDNDSTLPFWLRREQNGSGSRSDAFPGTRPDTGSGPRAEAVPGTRPDPGQPPGGNGAGKPQAEGPPGNADIPYTSMSGVAGLICQSLTTEVAQTLGLDSPQGMIVTGVTTGGAASQAGIRVKDVILRVNGEPTRNLSGIGKLGGQVVPVELLRQGKRQVVQLQLAGR